MASISTQLQDGAFVPSGFSSWKYEVFFSFRGADTRDGFVDHLSSALHQMGIFTFKDDRKLERSESISPALLKAIEESRFAVVVFSQLPINRRRSQFVFRADQQLMASTSTQFQQDGASLPSGSSSWKYDVFLSFRGTDTRNGFVDHLYSALHEKVIFTFKDDQRLERGESISPTLLKAIEESRLAVVVFSENYASSKWCLEELVKILECQKKRALTVLPVFYKVDPSDLRNQRGSVGEAFAQHERVSTEEEEKQKVQRWRNALTEAANSSGWHSETYGPEAKLVRDIAINILNRLGDNGSSILEDVVGLLPRIEEVMSKLEMRLDLLPRIVGICGMGGIGKTTIAKAVYHQIRSQFVGSCYLEKVRENCEKRGLESLQKSLLLDICSVSDSDIKIRNIDWPGLIRNAVGNKKVLVVLDDVDHSDQLDALVGRLDWFGPGSRIIITTRNSHLLARYGPRSHVYNVEGLNDEEAFKLFCCKAFWSNQPTPGFEDLIKSAVDYAKGVPLALEVLGSFLISREVNEWQSAIHRLGQEPNRDIQKVLKLSYDGLGDEEQQIFLDIACFFKRYSNEYSKVVNMLDGCGFQAVIGISVLKDRALVTIRDSILTRGKTIDMHDLIQEMGWHIVNEESPKEPGRRSRLWKSKDIYDTVTKKTRWGHIIALKADVSPRISTKNLDFTQVANLKQLILDSNFSEGFLPDYLGTLSWLEYLDLSGTNIINLPISIRDLYELQYLDLRNCKKLKTLPYLPTNTIIAVNGCTSLETLMDPAIFPIQFDGSFTNCYTLIKNRPSRLLEFLRNILKKKNNKESHIVVLEREIPKYVGVQLRPDWYQRLRGFVVCAVFEETAPSIDDERYAECYVMWNDVVVYSTRIYIGSVQFQFDPLFLHYMAIHDWVGEIRRAAEVNDLKKNEIIFYFRKSSPEIVDIVAPVKCAVHIVYENDEEWSDSHLSIQQSDYDKKEKSP